MPGQIVFSMEANDLDLDEHLIYKIEQQVYHYGTNKANSDAFEIPDSKSGQIVLQKSIHDVGGMFELDVAASDLTDNIAHIARATIKVSF